MTVLGILRESDSRELWLLLAIANVGALANAALLASINRAAQAPGDFGLDTVWMFVVWLLIYVSCSRWVNHSLAELLEQALHRIKVRVGRKLIDAELEALEQVRAGEICDRITENVTFISDRSQTIASYMQSILLLAFLSIYVAWLSLPALVLLVLIVAIGLGLFGSMRREFGAALRRTAKLRVVFFERLSDLLDGFKQLKFSRQASRELEDDLAEVCGQLRTTGIVSSGLLADSVIFSHALVFAMLGGVAYALRGYTALDEATLASLIAATVFLRRPVFSLSLGIMPLTRSNFALSVIARLEAKLEHAAKQRPKRGQDPWKRARPARIELDAVEYRYDTAAGERAFGVGPLSFALDAGELVFVVGGNGSGKSTLFKVLAGLYPAQAGRLRVDGVEVDAHNLTAYREQVCAVFTDFHLFERLHGLPEATQAQVDALLERVRLDGVVRYAEGRFSRLDLSTGQRKRLALVVALLEDRPIYLFDEWAADQDPSYRAYFYDELLPELRAAGKLVIAISHDDRYFDRADRVLIMDAGQLRTSEEGPT